MTAYLVAAAAPQPDRHLRIDSTQPQALHIDGLK